MGQIWRNAPESKDESLEKNSQRHEIKQTLETQQTGAPGADCGTDRAGMQRGRGESLRNHICSPNCGHSREHLIERSGSFLTAAPPGGLWLRE